MSNAQTSASEAARELARARWGTQTLDRAVGEVLQRRSELTDGQRAELVAAVNPEEAPDAV